MNSWKLNTHSRTYYINSICNSLNIQRMDIYKIIKNVDKNNVIELHDGRKFKLELKEII